MSKDKIAYLSKRDYRLAKVIEQIGSLTVQKYDDPFAFLVHEIIGQMLSDKVRNVIIGRFDALLNGNINPYNVLNLNEEQMCKCGMSLRKCNSIKDLAHAVSNGRIDLNILQEKTDEEVISILTSIKGIGVWTAKMFLLFYLGREDILPLEDAAFMQSFKWLYGYKNPSKETVIRRCTKWKPYSSMAARYMYRALDTGLTKIPTSIFIPNL